MRVLVTGAAGFIGGHLTQALADAGHTVLPTDLPVDLRDPESAPMLLDRYRPDRVVHLAAQVGRQFGEDDPARSVTTNALATTLLAKACGDRNVSLTYASTSEVYGDRGDLVCAEDGPLWMPNGIYGLTKRWGEEAVQLYAPRWQILRLSMPYGPGLFPGRGRAAIVNMLWQADNRRPMPVHRDAKRSWCWVGDAVRAMRLVIDLRSMGVFNVGRDDAEVSMLQVAELACQLTGAPESLIDMVDPPERQTVVKRLNTHKIRALGWQPEVDLAQGMKRTLAWLRAHDFKLPD
jgi:nucleoside-diphosphate-sugar epimerase